ncbi:MAG TPA: hypothetical protein IAD07_05340 [Candidatus Fimivicinus intestinavium]|nr:hypothetical protein [Candidatus Fimivicinus intestinavium]
MYRKLLAILMAICLIAALFAGCGGKGADDPSNTSSLTGEGNAAGAEAVLPGETQDVDGPGTADQNAGEAGNANTSGGTGSSATGGNAAGAGTATRPAGGASGATTAARPSGSSPSATRPSGSGNGSTTKPTTTKPSGGGSSSTTTKPTTTKPATTKPTTTKPSTTKPSGGGSTQPSKADIVNEFNAAANKVKTGRPGLKYDMTFSMSVSSGPLPDFPMDALNESGTVAKGKNLNSIFPVSGQSWSSRLPVSAVQSASRTLKDGKYTIKLTLNAESCGANVGGSAHGKVFTVLDLDDLNASAAEQDLQFQNISHSFSGSIITCVVDARTGNMLSATYVLNDNISTKIVSSDLSMNARLKTKMVSNYTMSW